MWVLLAKNLLRTKLYEDCSRILLRTPKGKPRYQKYLSLSSKPWLHSARIAQAVQTFNIGTTIQKVETLEKKQFICVHWEDGSESLYPSVWLRDNCQCPDCFLHSAKARKLLLENLDIDIEVKDVILTEQKKVKEFMGMCSCNKNEYNKIKPCNKSIKQNHVTQAVLAKETTFPLI